MIRPLHALFALLAFLLPAGAWANIPAPTMFGFVAQGWAVWASSGAALVGIVSIETVMLKWLLAISGRKVLLWVTVMNAVSPFAGLLAGGSFITMFLLCILLFFAFDKTTHFGIRKLRAFACWAGLVALLYMWAVFTFGHGMRPLYFWGSLVPAYFSSVIIEGLVLVFLGKGLFAPRALLAANALSYLFLTAMLIFLGMSPEKNPSLTAAYFQHITTSEHLERGDVDAMMHEVRIIQVHFPGQYSGALRQLRIARRLIELGELHLAREIVEHIEAQENWDHSNLGVEEQLERTRRELATAESDP